MGCDCSKAKTDESRGKGSAAHVTSLGKDTYASSLTDSKLKSYTDLNHQVEYYQATDHGDDLS